MIAAECSQFAHRRAVTKTSFVTICIIVQSTICCIYCRLNALHLLHKRAAPLHPQQKRPLVMTRDLRILEMMMNFPPTASSSLKASKQETPFRQLRMTGCKPGDAFDTVFGAVFSDVMGESTDNATTGASSGDLSDKHNDNILQMITVHFLQI